MHLNTCLAHAFQDLWAHIKRPDVVIEHLHLDTLTCLEHEQFNQLLPHGIVLDNEVLEVDEVVGILDVAHHGIKLGPTRGKHLNIVAHEQVPPAQLVDQRNDLAGFIAQRVLGINHLRQITQATQFSQVGTRHESHALEAAPEDQVDE